MNAIKMTFNEAFNTLALHFKDISDMDKVEFIADGVELSQNKAMGAPVTLLDLNSD